MKKSLFTILSVVLFMVATSWSPVKTDTLAEGSQPQIGTDQQGIIRVVFGSGDKVFCVLSRDQGLSFSAPVLIGQIPGLHLGMSRGPQVASSASTSIVTAMDKAGNIHWFKLGANGKGWKKMGTINNIKGTAPEGLMSIAADKNDHFYAVWLDTRTGHKNQIYFSSLPKNATRWSANVMAYQSPEDHVCECCKPAIAVQGQQVAIMFRNWLHGSRDLYVLRSFNNGKSFKDAQRLGMGTWILKGCPMDGGGIVFDSAGGIQTAWQRQGEVYFCKPAQPEIEIATGRNCSIAGTGDNSVITMQHDGLVKLIKLKDKNEIVIGEGSFLKAAVLPDHKILCVWEQGNKIKFKKV
jgi:hypothetical protein